MKWTKLHGDALGEGLSTLDLPWLGSLRCEHDQLLLLIKYLNGERANRIWEDTANDAYVGFQENPFRVTELKIPSALALVEGGADRAFKKLVHNFLKETEYAGSYQKRWEDLVSAASEQVSTSQIEGALGYASPRKIFKTE
jgi:hypothetical protein